MKIWGSDIAFCSEKSNGSSQTCKFRGLPWSKKDYASVLNVLEEFKASPKLVTLEINLSINISLDSSIAVLVNSEKLRLKRNITVFNDCNLQQILRDIFKNYAQTKALDYAILLWGNCMMVQINRPIEEAVFRFSLKHGMGWTNRTRGRWIQGVEGGVSPKTDPKFVFSQCNPNRKFFSSSNLWPQRHHNASHS